MDTMHPRDVADSCNTSAKQIVKILEQLIPDFEAVRMYAGDISHHCRYITPSTEMIKEVKTDSETMLKSIIAISEHMEKLKLYANFTEKSVSQWLEEENEQHDQRYNK